MRERLLTLVRPSPRIQVPVSTITRKRKMTSRIGLSKKKQFTQLSTALRRDQ